MLLSVYMKKNHANKSTQKENDNENIINNNHDNDDDNDNNDNKQIHLLKVTFQNLIC